MPKGYIKCCEVWGFLIKLNLPEAFLKVNYSQGFGFWQIGIDIIWSVGEKWFMQDCLIEISQVQTNIEFLSTFGVLRLDIHIAWDPWGGLVNRHQDTSLLHLSQLCFLNSSCWWTDKGLHGDPFWRYFWVEVNVVWLTWEFTQPIEDIRIFLLNLLKSARHLTICCRSASGCLWWHTRLFRLVVWGLFVPGYKAYVGEVMLTADNVCTTRCMLAEYRMWLD